MKFPQILFTFEKVIRVQRDFVKFPQIFLKFCSHLKKLFEYNGMFLSVYKASVWGSISELYPRKSETQKTSGNMCRRLFVDVL